MSDADSRNSNSMPNGASGRPEPPSRGRRLFFAIVLLAIPFAFSLLVDRALALFDFTTEEPVRVAHPPHLREMRHNVEFNYEFATNREGLRYRDIPVEKPPSTYRIFVVGDSMTEGVGVEARDTWSALLEERFAKDRIVEFINAGLGGTGAFEYCRVFLSVGLRYGVDALLVAVFENDVSNASSEDMSQDLLVRYADGHFFSTKEPERSLPKRLLHALWPRVYTRIRQARDAHEFSARTRTTDFTRTISEEARRRGIPESDIEAWRARLPPDLVELVNEQRLSGNVLSYGLLNPHYSSDSLDIDTPEANARWNSMAILLTRMVDEARRRGIEVALVYLPDRVQYDPASHVDNPFEQSGVIFRDKWLHQDSELQKHLLAWSRNVGVPFLDLTPIFREQDDKRALTYPIDGHWTPAGHRVTARAIGDWLERAHVFSLSPGREHARIPGAERP